MLLILFYWFITSQEFSLNNFIIGSFIFVIASVTASFIVISDILDKKEQHNKRLIHLVKEVLHEINLPIATIDANISLISKNLNPKDIKRAKRIQDALKRLKRLYKQLSYSIQKDILPIDKEEFDLKDLVEDSITNLSQIYGNRFNLNLKPLKVVADKIGLEQTVDNIIENSLKYSKDSIEISIKDNRLIIKDYGKGMDASELLKIYDRYYQSDKNYKGQGIGLSLVKEFCDKEGIDIKINSKVNYGTEVILSFNTKS